MICATSRSCSQKTKCGLQLPFFFFSLAPGWWNWGVVVFNLETTFNIWKPYANPKPSLNPKQSYSALLYKRSKYLSSLNNTNEVSQTYLAFMAIQSAPDIYHLKGRTKVQNSLFSLPPFLPLIKAFNLIRVTGQIHS